MFTVHWLALVLRNLPLAYRCLLWNVTLRMAKRIVEVHLVFATFLPPGVYDESLALRQCSK